MVTPPRRDANRLVSSANPSRTTSLGWKFTSAVIVPIILTASTWLVLRAGTAPWEPNWRQGWRSDAQRAVAIALENGRGVTSALEAVPAAERTADWSYFAALDSLTRGESRRATEQARAAAERGAARAWIITAWLRVVEGDAPLEPTAEVVGAWRRNRTFREIGAALAWGARQHGHTFTELSGISRVRHFGDWPKSLAAIIAPKTRGTEKSVDDRSTVQRRWLSDSRGLLIGRLSGSSRDDVPDRDVLVSYFDDRRDTKFDAVAARRALEGFARIAGDRAPIFLWVVHSKDAGIDDRVQRALAGATTPLFVAFTSELDVMTRPRFSLAQGHTWIRADRKLHAYVPPGIPLACTANTIARDQ